MALKRLIFSAMASLVYAESSITTMYFPDFGGRLFLQASIVGNDASATTYSLNCPKGMEPVSCGVEGSTNLSYIANGDNVTLVDAWTEDPTRLRSITCSLDGTSTAFCSWTSGGRWQRVTDSEMVTQLSPVTVTAGKVTGAASASQTESSGPKETASETGSEAATSTPTGGASRMRVRGWDGLWVGLVGVVLI